MTSKIYNETAWAKVNLTLSILGKREDGYHQLESLVVFAGCGDELSFFPSNENNLSPTNSKFELDVTGPEALTIEGENLVETVGVHLFTELSPFSALPLASKKIGDFHLKKQLPVAAGLGGGSADAAALLRLVKRFLTDRGADFSDFDFVKFAQKFGADIPVCISSVPAFMQGIGEIVQPIKQMPKIQMLLVNPRVTVSTASVFQAFNASPFQHEESQSDFDFCSLEFSSIGSVISTMERIPNDLLEPALKVAPKIGEVLNEIAQLDRCVISRLSGSGATCFGLFETEEDLQRAGAELRARFPKWWIKETFVRPLL